MHTFEALKCTLRGTWTAFIWGNTGVPVIVKSIVFQFMYKLVCIYLVIIVNVIRTAV